MIDLIIGAAIVFLLGYLAGYVQRGDEEDRKARARKVADGPSAKPSATT